MIGSDNSMRGNDRPWAPRGVGHQTTFRCWCCNKAKSTDGSREIGRLKLKFCAECAKTKEKR